MPLSKSVITERLPFENRNGTLFGEYQNEKHLPVKSGSDKPEEAVGKRTERCYAPVPEGRMLETKSNQSASNDKTAIHFVDSFVFSSHARRRDGGVGNDRWRLRAFVLRYASLGRCSSALSILGRPERLHFEQSIKQ